jgi:hypothetical protein
MLFERQLRVLVQPLGEPDQVRPELVHRGIETGLVDRHSGLV